MTKGGKSVAFKVPSARPAASADAWVADRSATPETPALKLEESRERMTRLTIDVPQTLHRRVKAQCAGRGLKMADVIRDMLEREFPAS